MLEWVKRLVSGAFILLLAAMICGVCYEQWSRQSVVRTVAPIGTPYDVSGHRSHLHCIGEGSPTVILEAGLDHGGSQSWSNVHPDLAKGSRVCAYDRAGIMWSQSRDGPRDAVSIADELHALLATASEPPPYVMVGHSLGGPLVRVFDHRFPGEVVGFVFVDSSHLDQQAKLPSDVAKVGGPLRFLVKTMSTVGIIRLTWSSAATERLPEEARMAVKAFLPTSTVAAMRERAAMGEILEQSALTGDLGARPTVVLTAGLQPDHRRTPWSELQAQLAELSTNSDHRVVPNASHYVHWDDPGALIAAVADVVEAARNDAAVRTDGG